MNPPRLLLCCDLDRTLIPNGAEPEGADARVRFATFCRHPKVCLVYVSGRHLALVEQAVKRYALPQPDYVISDVGTQMYRRMDAQWQKLEDWQAHIQCDWRQLTREELEHALQAQAQRLGLRLQEAEKQNIHKLSYYADEYVKLPALLSALQTALDDMGVNASLIWSVDEPARQGLLDVLPRRATKLHAIEFLRQHLGYERSEVLFAGDSGNDLPVLASPVRSVLVANASASVKMQAQQACRENGCEQALYIAQNDSGAAAGNYASGVLQGVAYFEPWWPEVLEDSVFNP